MHCDSAAGGLSPHGKHLIAGEWVAGQTTFALSPAHGPADDYSAGTPALVDSACEAAEDAFRTYGRSSRAPRATFLDAIADEIEARADVIIVIATQETGLPEARLQGECVRTTSQVRIFAHHIVKGDDLDRRHDRGLPDRRPHAGQLTATLQMDAADVALAKRLVLILERKALRLLVNGFPTWVGVADAMVHGGPFPASTHFGARSVGTLSFRRFLRPFSYQNLPSMLLPANLADGTDDGRTERRG